MKKLIATLFLAVSLAVPSFGRPHGGFRPHSPPPRMHHVHRHHHGFGYRHVAIPAAALAVGIAVGQAFCPPPAVMPPPPPPQRIWVPGTFVTEFDRFGRPYQRYVPGHWVFR